MNNPMQTGDGVGLVSKIFTGIASAVKSGKKSGRKDSFSDGASSHDAILKTARAMAKDKYKYKQEMMDKKIGAFPLKGGTKFDAQLGKTRISGTAPGAAAKPVAKKPAAKKPLTTKQAAMSVPAPKKPTANSTLKTAAAKTAPPTSVKSRKVK